MAKVNLQLPRIDMETLSDSQAIQRIMSYLYQLNERLRYELTHIDEDNMTGNAGAAGISNAAIRSVVQKELENQVIDITNNVTILEIIRRLDSIDLSIGNVKRTQKSDEDSIAQIQQALNTKASQAAVDGLSSTVSTLSGTVSSLSSTVSTQGNTIGNIQRTQQSDEAAISQLQTDLNTKAAQATVNALSSSLTSLSGNVTTLSGNLTSLQTAYNTHKHSVSVSGGTVTIGGPTQGSSSFNIADTQFYKDAVRSAKNEGIQSVKIKADDIILDPTGTLTYYSASKKYSVPVYAEATNGESNTNGIMIDASEAWNAGWDAARAKVVPPGRGTDTSFTIDVPSATRGETQTYTFTMVKGATPGTSGYASVALGQYAVARIPIGDWYSAGYNAGFTAGQTAGEAYGYTQGWNAAEAQYSEANHARKDLTKYGYADMYVKERETYYPAGNHYWYWSGSDGWDTLYTKS